jgi:hypothetical protein
VKRCRWRVLFIEFSVADGALPEIEFIVLALIEFTVPAIEFIEFQEKVAKDFVVLHHRGRPVDVRAAPIGGNIAVEILGGARNIAVNYTARTIPELFAELSDKIRNLGHAFMEFQGVRSAGRLCAVPFESLPVTVIKSK